MGVDRTGGSRFRGSRRRRSASWRLRLLAAGLTGLTATGAFATPAAASVAPGVPGHDRAWELVTPGETVAATVARVGGVADSGDRVSFFTYGPLPGAPAGPGISSSIAVRGATGWTSTPHPVPDSPTADTYSDGPAAFTPELTSLIWRNQTPYLAPGDGSLNLFAERSGGQYSLLANLGPGGGIVEISRDLGHVVVSTASRLSPADAGRTEGQSLYEVGGSEPRLVNVDSSGALLSPCGASARAHTVADEGGRIFFVSPPPGSSCPQPPRAYLREGEATTEISASRCTRPDCNGPREVAVVGTTPSGSSAFLVTAEQLTDDDTDEIPDLYRYDVAGGELVRISAPRPPGHLPGGATTARVWPSADGSRVYFEFIGWLVPDGGNEAATNLYLADENGVHLVADISGYGLEISRDGRYALLDLGGGYEAEDTDGRADVYRYDAVDRSYTRVSAGPFGAGNGPFDTSRQPTFFSEGVASHPHRTLSLDGRRAIFSTDEPLLAQDRNEVTDVYEWSDGNLGLISPGLPGAPSAYLAMNADGGTVLFRTGAALLPRDRDGGDLDIYAARIGGGFAEAVPPAPGCDGPCGAPQGRLDRGEPFSAGQAAGRGGGIRLSPLGAAALRQVVASGWLTVLAEVPGPGRLTAAASALHGGRRETVARGATTAGEAGPVRLRARLTREARRRLRAGQNLRVRLVVRLAGKGSSRSSFTLQGAR